MASGRATGTGVARYGSSLKNLGRIRQGISENLRTESRRQLALAQNLRNPGEESETKMVACVTGEGRPVTLVPAAVPPSAPTESASPIHIALPPYRSRGVVFSSVSYGSTSVLLVYSTLDSISRSGFLRISLVGVVHVLPALWFGLSGTVRVARAY